MISSNHSISSRINTISRKVPFLKHCCCCVSLTNGVRATTVTALIFGVAFMFLAHSELVMEDYCVVISHLCRVTAVLFFAWFLALMLMLSLNIRFSFRLTVWIAWFITVWLLIKILVFAALEFFLTDNSEHKNYLLLILIIFQSLVGNIFTIYSIWLIKSYIHQVLKPSWTTRVDVSRVLERPHRTSIVSSTASQISNWPVVWKSPGEVASVTSVPSRLRTNLEAKQFEERSNVIGSSSNKNDRPGVVENLFDERTVASIKEPPEGFKTPVLQILFLNEHPKNLVKHDSSVDDIPKNDKVSPHSQPEERQENNKKFKSNSQFPQVQEDNDVLYLNEIKKKDCINVLKRIPQPLKLHPEKNNVEINSQSPSMQDAVLEEDNHTLNLNKVRYKAKRIKNGNINQQNKEQQTIPVCSVYETPSFIPHRNSKTNMQHLEPIQFQQDHDKEEICNERN